MSDTTRHRCKNLVWFGDWYCRRKLMETPRAHAVPVNPAHCSPDCQDWMNGDLVQVRPRVEEEHQKA